MLNTFKRFVRTIYILALMIFTLWYGYFLYQIIFIPSQSEQAIDIADQEIDAFFGEGTTEEEKEFIKSLKQQQTTSTTDLGYMVIEEQYVKGHFHHVGMKVETDNNSTCIRCHGAVPHDRAKTIRAFLNMHAFYMACETCHIRPTNNSSKYEFRWYDKQTGKITSNPPGLNTLDESMYGNYAAKISPGESDSKGNFKFINGAKELDFVERYLKQESRLNDTQKSKMKKVIHRNVNEDPLICDGCHTIRETPYLPFTRLGYPKRRLHELTSTEVVGMINKYQKFYIPNLLKGGGVEKDDKS
ncbi:MAG: hypothetical protein ABW092_12790 [Candidatus Thiodiazotropha sp.]